MPDLRFPRWDIPDLPPRPDWWLVRPDEILAALAAARKGSLATIAQTPAGFPVHALAYGPPRARPGTAPWSHASASAKTTAYKTDEAAPQVVMIVSGVHGAEPESTVGALSLISLLETGQDLRRRPRPRLLELAARYRLVILPCVNMDGRAISPDHLHGATNEQFVRANQGAWLDGTNVGYPVCKEYSPLPLDRVAYPGGYPNAAGFNIMHDCTPALLQTDEARGLLQLAAAEQADLVLHLHSHQIGGQILGQPLMAYPLHVNRTHTYKQRIFDALAAANLRPAPVHPIEQRTAINLAAATTMASGALSVIFEQSSMAAWTFDEALETFYVMLETFLATGLSEPFSPRTPLARGKPEA